MLQRAARRGGFRFRQDANVGRPSVVPSVPPCALRCGAHGASGGRRSGAAAALRGVAAPPDAPGRVPGPATSCSSAERRRCHGIGCAGRRQLRFAAEAEMMPVLWPCPAASALGGKKCFLRSWLRRSKDTRSKLPL